MSHLQLCAHSLVMQHTHNVHVNCLHDHSFLPFITHIYNTGQNIKMNHQQYRAQEEIKSLFACHSAELCQRTFCCGVRISISCCVLLHVNSKLISRHREFTEVLFPQLWIS